MKEDTTPEIKARLEYLRGEIEAERISYGEIAELSDLAPYIDPSDVVLLQWAGVPEGQYRRLEVTVGVMVPFEWDPEAEVYRLVYDELVTTTGGLFSDAEEGMWVPDMNEWYGAENAEMDSAYVAAWQVVASSLKTTQERMGA